jgi:hypothetical protein
MKQLKQIVNGVTKINKKSIMTFIYGERVKGEKIPEPGKFPERPLIQKEFEKWCNEFNVSTVHNRSIVHFNNY